MGEQRGNDYGCMAVGMIFLVIFVIGLVVVKFKTDIRDLQRRIATLEQERK